LDSDITKQISTVSTLKNYAPQLCNVTLGPSALGQHYTTSGHNFSLLTSAPVDICILSLTTCTMSAKQIITTNAVTSQKTEYFVRCFECCCS